MGKTKTEQAIANVRLLDAIAIVRVYAQDIADQSDRDNDPETYGCIAILDSLEESTRESLAD